MAGEMWSCKLLQGQSCGLLTRRARTGFITTMQPQASISRGLRDYDYRVNWVRRELELRRTFRSCLVQAGVGIERVSELLRHGDTVITARAYARLRPGDLAEAVAVLDRTGSPVSRSGFTSTDSSLNRNE